MVVLWPEGDPDGLLLYGSSLEVPSITAANARASFPEDPDFGAALERALSPGGILAPAAPHVVVVPRDADGTGVEAPETPVAPPSGPGSSIRASVCGRDVYVASSADLNALWQAMAWDRLEERRAIVARLRPVILGMKRGGANLDAVVLEGHLSAIERGEHRSEDLGAAEGKPATVAPMRDQHPRAVQAPVVELPICHLCGATQTDYVVASDLLRGAVRCFGVHACRARVEARAKPTSCCAGFVFHDDDCASSPLQARPMPGRGAA